MADRYQVRFVLDHGQGKPIHGIIEKVKRLIRLLVFIIPRPTDCRLDRRLDREHSLFLLLLGDDGMGCHTDLVSRGCVPW